jgi:hypothetical protein
MQILISSADCLTLFPDNKSNKFTWAVPRDLILPKSAAKIALLEVFLPPLKENATDNIIYAQSTAVEPYYTSGTRQRLLRILIHPQKTTDTLAHIDFSNLQRLNLETGEIDKIEFTFCNSKNQLAKFKKGYDTLIRLEIS